MRKSGIWEAMIFVFGRNPKSLGDALMIVCLFIVTTVCLPGIHATILAVEESAR